MSQAIEALDRAVNRAMAGRPRVGGFSYLAECLRAAGVEKNLWLLPACQSVYLMQAGAVVTQDGPLRSGTMDVPVFDGDALIRAIRTDQAAESSFPEFLEASWQAGVLRFEVDFAARTVTYSGARGEEYIEQYPAVEIG